MAINKYNKLLQKYFGYETLKELQYEIIESVLEGNDILALLPTSYGKSICYQIPFLYTNKNVIVISPLISLMQDQMRELKEKNIDVVCLNSTNKNRSEELYQIYNGRICIIYTTPEYLILNPKLIDKLIEYDSLALIAIDECHCISSWGNSFREDYRNLSCLKLFAPEIPIMALTATATNKVIKDIIKNLNLDEPKIIKHSVDRKNLYIEMSQRNDNTVNDKIIPLLNSMKEGKALIYCKTTNETDELSDKINKYGLKCESYHAKKELKERTRIQKMYTNGEINIIVSTIAFGMGINIPDIRLMIHYNCSNDVESYLQEIGRAGRDNKESKCFMFYSNKDFSLSYKFLEDIQDKIVRKHKEEDINYLKKIVTSDSCRRKHILKYFDEELEECNNCDNCILNKNKKNFTQEALLIFEMMTSLSYGLGTSTFIKILLGSKEKQLEKNLKYLDKVHGKGKYIDSDNWKKIFGLLINKEYLQEEYIKNQFFVTSLVKPSIKGLQWYNNYKSGEKEELVFNVSENFDCDNNKNKKINKKTKENHIDTTANEFMTAFKNKLKKEK